jgi:hypothetical protein
VNLPVSHEPVHIECVPIDMPIDVLVAEHVPVESATAATAADVATSLVRE